MKKKQIIIESVLGIAVVIFFIKVPIAATVFVVGVVILTMLSILYGGKGK